MERIVYGISTISFQGKPKNENCSPNQRLPVSAITDLDSAAMAESDCRLNDPSSTIQNASGTCESLKSDCDESDVDIDQELYNSDPCGSSSTAHSFDGRKMPSRACKESAMLHKTKRRSIVKPKKLLSGDLRPAQIKKIYTNKKLGRFHPSKLETIFEEPSVIESDDDNCVQLIGPKKLKRSLTCCDGVNVNKTLINQRRLKIKKTLGKRFALKKILLEDFMQRLNKNIDDDSERTDETT